MATLLLSWRIATNILRSSSHSDWLLRNISNDNGSFSFLRRFFCFPPSSRRFLLDLTISTPQRVSYKKQELITLRGHMGSPPVFGGVRVAHLFLVFCLVPCVVCPIYNAANVSGLFIVDCPFGFL